MPRARDPNRDKAFDIYKESDGKIDLVEIASQLNVSAGTVRGWKSKDKWEEHLNGTFQTKNTERSKRSEKKKETRKKAVVDEVKEVLQNTELTDKQQLFCIYYIRCFNATKAYQKAYGVDYATAVVAGSRLLGNVKVKEEILRLKQERLNREFLSESDIFQKYMDIAFADMNDYMTIKKGTVILKDSEKFDGTLIKKVSTGKVDSIELYDSMKALQWLTDHMDMATEKQRAEIAALRAKVQGDDDTEVADDGFLEALNGTAGEDWADEED